MKLFTGLTLFVAATSAFNMFQKMREKFPGLSDEDKENLIGADMLEKLNNVEESMKDMSEEERAAKKEEIIEAIKAKFESFTDEEKMAKFAQFF
ncbi:unnamed protein product [Oikopleura dioica]|uniref:Uncharacterized protein n=1 Tax=Oikopleura dioica TaxID=34765 RepID=E4XMK8_OIKDI|nr:unnamed protein product [Oikopleura dioica]